MPLILTLLKGLLIGFCIAAPVGPIAFLCIKNTLKHGFLGGMSVGVGAAIADAVCAVLGILGFALAVEFIHEHRLLLHFLGGIVLVAIGIKTVRAPAPADGVSPTGGRSGARLLANIPSTFFLTISNPATIFAFMAVFAALRLSFDSQMLAGVMIAGVFGGSLLWWLTLSSISHAVRARINAEFLHRINVCVGGIIAAFGVLALAYGIAEYFGMALQGI